jgi:hypothetical protein
VEITDAQAQQRSRDSMTASMRAALTVNLPQEERRRWSQRWRRATAVVGGGYGMVVGVIDR